MHIALARNPRQRAGNSRSRARMHTTLNRRARRTRSSICYYVGIQCCIASHANAYRRHPLLLRTLHPAEEVPSPEKDPASVCQLVFQSLQVGCAGRARGALEFPFHCSHQQDLFSALQMLNIAVLSEALSRWGILRTIRSPIRISSRHPSDMYAHPRKAHACLLRLVSPRKLPSIVLLEGQPMRTACNDRR